MPAHSHATCIVMNCSICLCCSCPADREAQLRAIAGRSLTENTFSLDATAALIDFVCSLPPPPLCPLPRPCRSARYPLRRCRRASRRLRVLAAAAMPAATVCSAPDRSRSCRCSHTSLTSRAHLAHTALISRAHLAHTALISCSYRAHIVLIPRSHLAHTSLISRSHLAHTSLTLRSYRARTSLTSRAHLAHIALTSHAHLAHTSLTPHSHHTPCRNLHRRHRCSRHSRSASHRADAACVRFRDMWSPSSLRLRPHVVVARDRKVVKLRRRDRHRRCDRHRRRDPHRRRRRRRPHREHRARCRHCARRHRIR